MEMGNQAEAPKPYEPFTIASFHKMVKELQEQDELLRKSGWKPEYFLSQQLAEEMPYEWLQWVCDHYRVIGSLETSLILERREKEHNLKSKP